VRRAAEISREKMPKAAKLKALDGDTPSAITARLSFPILVACAQSRRTITYGELDAELVRRKLGTHKHPLAYSHPAGIIGTERRVAAAIFDHYNQRTGQCDPSIGRISRLLEVSQRTVIRATRKCERVLPFIKLRHGGKFLRNQYVPDWERIQEIEDDWAARKRTLSRSSLACATSQNSQVEADNSVNQTFPTNHSKSTFPTESEKHKPSSSNGPRLSNIGIGKRRHTTRSQDAADNAAEARWNRDALKYFLNDHATYSKIVAMTEDLKGAATNAERLCEGAGIITICEALGIRFPET